MVEDTVQQLELQQKMHSDPSPKLQIDDLEAVDELELDQAENQNDDELFSSKSSHPKKKKRELGPDDEIVKFKMGDDGRLIKVVKTTTKKIVKLTTEQVIEIRDVFALFDKDMSGNIDVIELKDAMKALGFNYSKVQMQALMEQADKDGSGEIDQNEFLSLMARFIIKRDAKEELTRAFRMYDNGGNETIGFDELKQASLAMGEDLSDEELRYMLRIGDRFNRYDG